MLALGPPCAGPARPQPVAVHPGGVKRMTWDREIVDVARIPMTTGA